MSCRLSVLVLLGLLPALGASAVAQVGSPPTPAPAPAPAPAPQAQPTAGPQAVVVGADQRVVIVPAGHVLVAAEPDPFRLGLVYAHTFSQSGELADPRETANTLGLEFSFRGGRVVRQQFVLAHRWERSGNISRKGFRVDLVSLGFPIPVVEKAVSFHIEPILRVLRGDLIFQSVGGAKSQLLFRFESGVGLRLVAAFRRWYLAVDPVGVDFRYFSATTDDSRGGFSTLWSFGVAGGREF